MTPDLTCHKCGAAHEASAKYCSHCGARLNISSQKTHVVETGPDQSGMCTACGYVNVSGAAYCASCGTLLKNPRPQRAGAADRSPRGRAPNSTISFFQSWRFTVIVAVLLIGAILFFTRTQKTNPHEGGNFSPGEQSAIQEIETLQKHVDATPGDTATLLRLANLLQDVRFYPRAIETYQKYLQLAPRNTDAMVDLGTSYFALSFEDSSRKDEYLASARREILDALAVNPNHQLAYFNLGIVEFHSGNVEAAMSGFRKCIAIDSTSDAGKKAKQFLSQHPFNNSP